MKSDHEHPREYLHHTHIAEAEKAKDQKAHQEHSDAQHHTQPIAKPEPKPVQEPPRNQGGFPGNSQEQLEHTATRELAKQLVTHAHAMLHPDRQRPFLNANLEQLDHHQINANAKVLIDAAQILDNNVPVPVVPIKPVP